MRNIFPVYTILKVMQDLLYYNTYQDGMVCIKTLLLLRSMAKTFLLRMLLV